MSRPATPPESAAPRPATAPSHVFIVRHGARLDMADAAWAASAGAPYNSPLTYTGWLQARATGARIASLLPPVAAGRRRRVVIHSSPFLRCVQTSVSLASGLAQLHDKPLLRLDAWLGEWHNADYYTEIAPPPPASSLARTARCEFLDPVELPTTSADFPLPPLSGAWAPPTPLYSISGGGPIPRGYFNHAKPTVEFDEGWNAAQLGRGSEGSEEWSAMHRRFRHGFRRLVGFYKEEAERRNRRKATAENLPEEYHFQLSRSPRGSIITYPTPPLSEDGSDDEESALDANTDTVVILVSHAAGCNALIGAITDQPVLIDIGTTSLTHAVLRAHAPAPAPAPAPSAATRAPGHLTHMSFHTPAPATPAVDSAIASYELQQIASTEHLRPAPRPRPQLTVRDSRSASVGLWSPNMLATRVSDISLRPSTATPDNTTAAAASNTSTTTAISTVEERAEGKVEGLMKKEVVGRDALAAAGLCNRRLHEEEERNRDECRRKEVAPQIPVGGDACPVQHAATAAATTAEKGEEMTTPPVDPIVKQGLWGMSTERSQPRRRWTVSRSEF